MSQYDLRPAQAGRFFYTHQHKKIKSNARFRQGFSGQAQRLLFVIR